MKSSPAEEYRRVFPRDFQKQLLEADRGEGIYIYTTDGSRYIDGCSGALVSNIGHGVEEIVEAMATQAQRIAFAHQSRILAEPTRKLAKKIAEFTPGDVNHVFFVSGGSEATEAAMKMSRQFFVERDGPGTSKHIVVGRWIGFHGVTMGALSAGGNVVRRRPFVPMLNDNPHIEPPYCYRCPFELEYPSCSLRCARQLEELIQRCGPENVAAFIFEPIVGAAAGAMVPPEGYLQEIREICDRNDVLMIADEVMTGFGRTGTNFGVDHWDVVPDIIAVAKGMSAGYTPMGGVIANDRIKNVFVGGSGKFVHGHTYGGNPLSSATALAVLEYIDKHNLVQASADRGEYLLEKLQVLMDNPIVGDVRGKGLMVGVELVKDKATREPFPRSMNLSERVTQETVKRGAIVYPGGGMAPGLQGDQFLIGPPLTITEEQVDELVEAIEGGLAAVAAEVT